MNPDPASGSHWTDEQILASLYDLGPKDGHLRRCEHCNSRHAALSSNRCAIEAARSDNEEVSLEFLLLQRRAICRRLDTGRVPWTMFGWRRWAPALLTVLLLAGVTAMYQERHVRQFTRPQPSDAQLALEVSAMAQEWQAEPAVPLQGLFE
jgi:hypothetical protein